MKPSVPFDPYGHGITSEGDNLYAAIGVARRSVIKEEIRIPTRFPPILNFNQVLCLWVKKHSPLWSNLPLDVWPCILGHATPPPKRSPSKAGFFATMA